MNARTHPALEIDGIRDEARAALIASDLGASALEQTGDERWRLFFDTAANRDHGRRQLADGADLAIESIEVSDEGWAARSQALLSAVTVGAVIVAPPWDVPTAPNRRVIVIEPSMGFGTGHHPSTRLCLSAIQEDPHAASAPLRRTILDVGTGSGVLGIAASLLGATDVLGIDVDSDAVESARRNLALNPGAHARFECAGIATFAGPARDLVFANLIMELLRQHAAALAALVNDDGVLIASGFTTEQEQTVVNAFEGLRRPLRPANRFVEGDWIALVLTR